MKKEKCEEIGFVHAWQEIENHLVFDTYPPSYPPRQRKCMNCGKEEKLITKQQEIKEWI